MSEHTRFTNAPPAYDYHYVTTVCEEAGRFTGTGGTHPALRCIVIDADEYRLNYQTMRYYSGLYSVLTLAEWMEQVEAGLIEVTKKCDLCNGDDNDLEPLPWGKLGNMVMVCRDCVGKIDG